MEKCISQGHRQPLIELKWNKTSEGAVGQIKRHDYPQVFNEYGGKILLVGINYDAHSKKHTCMIEEYPVFERKMWKNTRLLLNSYKQLMIEFTFFF